MLGTIFWEIYNIRQVCSRNPVATEKDLVPFPDKTKKEVNMMEYRFLCVVVGNWLCGLLDIEIFDVNLLILLFNIIAYS